MKRSIILLTALIASAAFTGCVKDTPPETATGDGTAVVINEAHSRGKDSQYPLDWVELYNNSNQEVDISGYVLSDKADMSEKITIPAGTKLPAHGFLQVVVDTEDGFGLSSDGDVVYLYNNRGQNIDNIEFGPMATSESWSANPDGSDTFEMMTPTPGFSNTGDVVTPPSTSAIVINEAHSRGKDSEYPLDWVELYNNSDSPADIGGYILSDKADMSEKITIPAGTTLAAHGFLKVEVDTEDGFGLSSGGDAVHLYNKDGENIHSISFGAMDIDESWSAVPDGSNTFRMQTPTPGASNTENVPLDPEDPKDPEADLSKLFINEVKVSDAGTDTSDWIEFYNAGDAPIDMAGMKIVDSGNKPFTIPAGKTIAAKGFLTFTEGETGSFTFGLGKSGETVELRKSDDGRIDFIDLSPAGELGDNAFPAYERTTDGGSTWAKTATPTKGRSNN